MKVNDIVLGGIFGVLGVAIILHARTFPVMAGMQFGPEFFPIVIGLGMALAGLGLLVSGIVAARQGACGPMVEIPDWMRDRLNVLRALGIIAAVAFYIVTVPFLGFLLTMFLTTLGLLTLLGNSWWLSGLIALILPVVLHFGFSVGLRVPLPRGVIEVALF